jgi:PAS domain S-box-containing protein
MSFAPDYKKISSKGLIVVAIPLALNLLILSLLAYLYFQQQLETEREARARKFHFLASSLGRTFIDAGITTSTSVFRHNTKIADKYDRLIATNDGLYQQLLDLEKDDPQQTAKLKHMRLLENRTIRVFTAAKDAILEGRNAELLLQQPVIRDELQALIRTFLLELQELIDRERKNQQSAHHISHSWGASLRVLIFAGIAANIALSITLAWFLWHSIATRLRALMSNTQRLASDQELPPPMSGEDEIALLDKVYHEMAATLKEARRRERAIVDNALDVICTIDDKLTFVRVSPASELVWGYPPQELIGRTTDTVLADKDRSFGLALPVDTDKESALTFENEIRHRDGRLVDMLWSARWSPSERAYFCVAHDITARKAAETLLKESEARIRTIIENMPVGLLILDERGYIETTNKKLEEMLSRSYDDLMGEHLSKMLTGKEDASDKVMKSFLNDFYQRVGETQCTTGDGKQLPVELSLNEFSFLGQRKFLANLVDVSERKQIEKAREELINMVSHDLRTPLNSVQATMALLLSETLGKLDDSDLSVIKRSEHELQRLLSMVNGLLDLEKMRAGMLELNREVNSLQAVVIRSIDASRTLAEQKNIEFANEVKDCEFFGDGDRLVQVLLQMISFALDHASAGTTLRVTGGENSTGNAEVNLTAVADPSLNIIAKVGAGRSNNVAAVPRGSSITLSDVTEAGLGMAIASGIVAAHKGRLGIKTEQSNEFTCWFTIPLPDEDE